MHPAFLASIFIFTALLAACGSDDAQQTAARGAPGEQQLPAPAGTTGGVTGMPAQPGPGPVGPPSPVPPDVALDENGNPLLPENVPAEGTPAAGDVAAEPTPDDAVTVIRDYYAAINSGDFARAQALWADGGRASGQSPQQFAAGFAETTGVSVEVMPPGRVDAAAGSRFIEVPVAITSTQRDGSQRKYAGTYVLRRAVVDGATPEQRAWRVGSADIREVQP
ncbi:MAG TPA: hypothetical protein VGQ93_00685 [Lysobacter sp.]|jgi:hypothetical protein|nr:hypothetical protein [Lysobacter sp.]